MIGRAGKSLAPWFVQLRRLADAFGIDRAIFFTVLSRGWSVLAGPITVACVMVFFTPEEQGFYYTFSSILAIQIFFELGLTYVIMQCVSHEMASLTWSDRGTLTGDPVAKARVVSLFRLSLRWYSVVALIALVVLSGAGWFFFEASSPGNGEVSWQIPWLCVVATTACNLLVTPFFGTLEGCGKVAEVASITARQVIIGNAIVWCGMALGAKLYAASLLGCTNLIIAAIWLARDRRVFFTDLYRSVVPQGSAVRWREEVLPFQWRIAVSWFTGWFAVHLTNPVMFRYHGAAAAGQLGMSIRIVDSITALGYSWVFTKAAPFGSYIAQRDFATLNRVFRRASMQSLLVIAVCAVLVLVGYRILEKLNVPFLDRLVGFVPLSFLFGTALINCVVYNQAIYLRAHKKEPFLFLGVLTMIIGPLVLYFLGRPYGALGITAGFFFISLFVGLPLATIVFFRKRQEWHTTQTGARENPKG